MSNPQTQENRAVFTMPVGRWVSGSITEGNDKDDRGQLYVYKTGQNQGKPYLKFSFGVAIPKILRKPDGTQDGDGNWWTAAWGQKLYAVGFRFRSDAWQLGEGFSWKVKDGDENTKRGPISGKTNAELTGWAGHWVVFFTCNQLVPATVACPLYTLLDDARPGQFLPQPKTLDVSRIKRGDFVQVNCTVEPNNEVQKPGIFLNGNMVCLIGYGDPIAGGPDVSSAGFGQGVSMPVGASYTPTAGAPALPPIAAPAAPALPVNPGTATSSAPPLPGTPPAPVPPNEQFANPPVPQPPAAPPVPPVPPAGPVMTDKARAEGLTYDILKGGGWSDEQMKQHGYMA